jgi:type IV secretory pathway VirB2 component (pilin)
MRYMRVPSSIKLLSAYIATTTPLVISSPTFAATTDGSAQVVNFITNMINIATVIAGSAAAACLVWCGFAYFTAGGDMGRLERAKGIFKNAIIGLVIVLAAAVIVNVVSSQATSAFGS